MFLKKLDLYVFKKNWTYMFLKKTGLIPMFLKKLDLCLKKTGLMLKKNWTYV